MCIYNLLFVTDHHLFVYFLFLGLPVRNRTMACCWPDILGSWMWHKCARSLCECFPLFGFHNKGLFLRNDLPLLQTNFLK